MSLDASPPFWTPRWCEKHCGIKEAHAPTLQNGAEGKTNADSVRNGKESTIDVERVGLASVSVSQHNVDNFLRNFQIKNLFT